MRIKGTQRPRWSIIAKLCWSRVLSDDPAWVVFFWRYWNMFSWSRVLSDDPAWVVFLWKMLEHVLMGGFSRCCQGQTIWMSSFHMCLHYSSLSPCSWWAGVLCWMLQYPDQVLYSIIVNPRSIHACGSCISRGVVAPGVLEVVCRVLVAPAAAMSSASVRHLWGGNWR